MAVILLFASWRLGYRIFCRPSFGESVGNRLLVNTSFFRPLRYGQFFSKGLNKHIASGVCPLHAPWSPPAVFWAVWSVVVFSVKRVVFRPVAHVADEVYKSILSIPPVANANAAAAVISVLLKRWVIAAKSHLSPSRKQGVLVPALYKTMLCERLDIVLSSKTSAGQSVATSERVRVWLASIPAVANAIPLDGAVGFSAVLALHKKSRKALACEVNECTHTVSQMLSLKNSTQTLAAAMRCERYVWQ